MYEYRNHYLVKLVSKNVLPYYYGMCKSNSRQDVKLYRLLQFLLSTRQALRINSAKVPEIIHVTGKDMSCMCKIRFQNIT